MGSQIHILPEDLINKIAAGEVIERPASVVKELVENSIDAQATKITVEIQSAGSKLIRVSDNGHGMTKEDVELSIQRHSTSKINKLDDLFNIKTLGFRGEALPSIASVAKLDIISRRENAEVGTELKIIGGKEESSQDAGCPAGTTITAKDLFFNTPARKKFLKSPSTEMGHIGEIVSKYAIANPQISFELVSDGKPIVHSAGSGNLKDAIMAIYGADLVKGLVEIKADRVSGLISRPTLSRIDNTYEVFYVNKRYVRNFLLNRALQEAYRTLIPNNRFPVAFLFIEIDPQKIDVNVHPAKREVKFVRTQEVMDTVREAVARTLSGFTKNQSFSPPEYQPDEQRWVQETTDVLFPSTGRESPVADQKIEFEVSAIQPLFPIYQLKNTYLVCTDGEDLVLIDQHAAHERILYDQLTRESRAASSQTLLIPENIEFSPKEKALLDDNLDYLRSLGFDLEEFGGKTYILRGVPAITDKTAAKQLLADIISELQELGKAIQLEIKQENIKKLLACHSAIKAGDKLSAQEMTQLIKNLYVTENPLTCPHGRPTMIKLSEEELIKRFGR
ncbi:hypothetical protein A3H38_03650 [candidate division WOR-1 bacterium RIFCSPLOWO2_02_FULL_46_20]|uniref:DNA mismatch repair protein MutL n=1 Tax=candidate division WOR-1 bacterium RIFCSPLOWO2_02_FULL_46_20 TaxID=1802567 RepID=A0A1F4R4T1_UNCSA|nr:MAG: hypothetical protein A3J44_00500 [candidate division WOR-1 bacterium RIFCSPHIGHO2_02_FULL_45_12]OGC03120.1 MAG: hypothetical protein A3H38_03650 [candidate division WOR-1 bacterium RIFCSPLOWO2_02_FULL_46_20]